MFTWFIFVINPFVGTIFTILGLYKDRYNNVHYSIMFAFLFASLAYWFTPSHEMDLTRYITWISGYSNMPWNSFVEGVLKKEPLFIQELFFYGIAMTGNYQLLPAIVIFITYFITFYMVSDFANRHKICSKDMFMAIIFILCVLPLPLLISNVRNILAFVIFVFAIYRDLEQNKKNILTYFLYIIPIFIHVSALALLAIKLLTFIYDIKKKRGVLIPIGIISISLLVSRFATLIDNSIFSSVPIIRDFFTKADSYVNTVDSEYALYLQDSVVMSLQKLYFMIIAIFFLLVLYLAKRNFDKSHLRNTAKLKINTKLLSFYSLLLFVVLGSAPVVLPVYLRFVYPAILLSFVIIFIRNKYIKKTAYRHLISIGLIILSIVGLVHQVAFMVKMTNLYQMITVPMVRSLLNMFIP